MKQSQFFIKTQKEDPKDEMAKNAKLLIRAGFVDKLMAGAYSMLPLGLRVKNRIINIIREEMNKLGANEILMPALHPKSIWEATGRWDEIDVMYKLKDKSGRELTLGTTHEEVITKLVKGKVDSYSDLPFSLYQFQNKFRDEERAKSGLLRGREFTMKDLYSFHANEDSLSIFYEKAKQTYLNIFQKMGIGDITYFTYASGGSFSKNSDEFQTLSEVGEDTIFICNKCRVAINKEIIEDQKECPECGNSNLREEKSVEVGNIFKLGTRFSDSVDLKFKNESGEDKSVVMASYGIGIERLIGVIVETLSDDNGIVWPESVTPFNVHLLLIGQAQDDLKSFTDEVYDTLQGSGLEVLYDDRANIQPGEKFNDSDLIGIPWRVVVSKKTLAENKIEIKKREENETSLMTTQEFIKNFK
ncbi:MAG: aminoacyl--tRNA ligase-related protein [Candidatus Paceibacterota bacterium]